MEEWPPEEWHGAYGLPYERVRVDVMFKYDHHMIKDQTDNRCTAMCANRINRVALCWMEVWKDGRIEGWKNGMARMGFRNIILRSIISMMLLYYRYTTCTTT